MGRAGELPGDREELPPSALYYTGLTSLGESPPSEKWQQRQTWKKGWKHTGGTSIGGQVLNVKRWQRAHLDLSLQSSGWELTLWFSLLGQITIHWRISIFFYRFVPKYIVAWNRQLPYYTANKKCDLIQSYLWFKIGEDSHPILPCYSM